MWRTGRVITITFCYLHPLCITRPPLFETFVENKTSMFVDETKLHE